MEIQIGKTKYRVVFRHIIRCEIRTRETNSREVASGFAQCHPPDVFSERHGKVLAFRQCFDALRCHKALATPELRKAFWKQFFEWLDPRPGKKAPKPPRTYWNGEKCKARIVRVVVGKALLPSWWCASLEGQEREAVEVKYGGDKFYLDNEAFMGDPAGSGWRKVTAGKGSPWEGHRSVPVAYVVGETSPAPGAVLEPEPVGAEASQ